MSLLQKLPQLLECKATKGRVSIPFFGFHLFLLQRLSNVFGDTHFLGYQGIRLFN